MSSQSISHWMKEPNEKFERFRLAFAYVDIQALSTLDVDVAADHLERFLESH